MMSFVLVELWFVSVETVLSQAHQMISLHSKLKNMFSSGNKGGVVQGWLKAKYVPRQTAVFSLPSGRSGGPLWEIFEKLLLQNGFKFNHEAI